MTIVLTSALKSKAKHVITKMIDNDHFYWNGEMFCHYALFQITKTASYGQYTETDYNAIPKFTKKDYFSFRKNNPTEFENSALSDRRVMCNMSISTCTELFKEFIN